MNYYQQGDVLLKEFNSEITGKQNKNPLLYKGANHHHTLKGGAFLIIDNDKDRFLEVAEDTELTHEEHKTIKIPVGKYKLEIVQEYDHFLEESRNVID